MFVGNPIENGSKSFLPSLRLNSVPTARLLTSKGRCETDVMGRERKGELERRGHPSKSDLQEIRTEGFPR